MKNLTIVAVFLTIGLAAYAANTIANTGARKP